MSNKLAKDDTLQEIKSALQAHNTAFNAWAGALSSLTTGDKSSLAAAINWVYAKEQAHEQNAAMHDVYDYLDSVSMAETGAFIHNSLARGINLGSEPTADQYARIIDRTYKGLWLADYWSKSVNYTYLKAPRHATETWRSTAGDDTPTNVTNTLTMRIGDHDYYRRAGDNIDLEAGHLNIIPDWGFYGAPMNQGPNNTTAGAYAGSDMRTKYLAAAVSIFESFFGANHVLSYRDYLLNAVTDGHSSGGAWYDCRVELMDERQVYGGLIFDSNPCNGTNVSFRGTAATKQFALFRVAPWLISNRQLQWLRNVSTVYRFAGVFNYGNCHSGDASSVNVVRPAALIG